MQGRPTIDAAVSFELFPPVAPGHDDSLWRTVAALMPFGPRFFSITYGAGGSTQERTVAQIERVITRAGAAVAGHLTCVGRPRHEVDATVDRYLDLGVSRIVALRGDAPDGDADGMHPDGYADAVALVSAIRSRSDVPVSVAGYPEVHPRAVSAAGDLDNLARKVDAGADEAITQFFFDNAVYERFVDRVRARGIDVPIVPGIMPVVDLDRVAGFAHKCGATIPSAVVARLASGADALEDRRGRAVDLAVEQILGLVDTGVDQVHLYTMNQPEVTAAICTGLGLAPV